MPESVPRVPPTRAAVEPSSAAIFLVLRRMRLPLIVLITTFTLSAFILTLIPGTDADGHPWRMSVFDAFYFMSYTASTIGYGELPKAFNTAQRMWVTVSIYMSVVAWAYAIANVFGLLNDSGFRSSLSAQRFHRKVSRLREPFLLLVGFGRAGEWLAGALDTMDRRIVVLDPDRTRIDVLDLGSYHNDIPGYAGDPRDPDELIQAGIELPNCEGVVAMTGDEEINLSVVMTAALTRPDLPVLARTLDPGMAHRMLEFGTPGIIDPFDLFGDELILATRSPSTHRLIEWLTGPPGRDIPEAPTLPHGGRWVVCGYGRFGQQLVGDLHTHGVAVTVIDPDITEVSGVETIIGDATDPAVLARARLVDAVGFAAATGNDTTNLSLLVAARRSNPAMYVVGRQNRPTNASLFAAVHVDSLLEPSRLAAHEALARLGTPLLWSFIQGARQESEEWAAALLARIRGLCGQERPDLWSESLDPVGAPSLRTWLATGQARLGDLMHDPEDRTQPLEAVVLLIVRGDTTILSPDDDEVLDMNDRLLVLGSSHARNALDTTLYVPAALDYVVDGRRVGSGWAWRTFVNRN